MERSTTEVHQKSLSKGGKVEVATARREVILSDGMV